MANYHEHRCFTCGETFEYCRRCVIMPVIYHEEGFCSERCSDIFNILSKHGCGLATVEETINSLSVYDLEGLTEGINKHIESLKEEIKREVEHDEPTQE